MKHLNRFLLAVMLIALTACATKQPIPNAEIPAALRVPCEQLEELRGLTGKDLTENITHNAAVYHRCSDSHQALIEAVKPKDK